MSTTVSYKGNTIATLSNETKTLNTAGTWVEADIVVTDSGSGTAAISVVDTTDSHGGTIREITGLDISDTTAVASDVAQGKYFYTASGVKTAGTGSGSGSSNYTRTTIAPEQTVTPTSNGTYLSATLNTSAFESGEEYIITYNGTEYYYTCIVMWGTNYLLGDANYFYGTTGLPYPFGIIWMNGTTCTLACGDSTTVTVKIEKLEFVGSPSATAHTIYFEFLDNTNTTITAYYDDSFISNAITATIPSVYNNKNVDLAQLDGVTWYNPANIPLNTQLVDFTTVTPNVSMGPDGTISEAQWYGVTDYIRIDPNMTFSFKGSYWGYSGFYDSSLVFISAFSPYGTNDMSQDSDDSNVGVGTIGGNGVSIPLNAAFIRISTVAEPDDAGCSLIRTA